MFCTHTRYNILPFIYEFRYWLYFRLKYIIALCCKSRIKSRVTFGGLFEWNSRIRHVLNLNVSENTKCCGNIACSPLSFNRRILDRVQRMKLINSGDFTSCEWKKWIFCGGKSCENNFWFVTKSRTCKMFCPNAWFSRKIYWSKRKILHDDIS